MIWRRTRSEYDLGKYGIMKKVVIGMVQEVRKRVNEE